MIITEAVLETEIQCLTRSVVCVSPELKITEQATTNMRVQ